MSAAARIGTRGTALGGLGPALVLLVRRFRMQVLAWVAPLWALTSMTPSYESAYPSLESRGALIETMRENVGTRLLYGIVPRPGRIGQLAQWELGTYLLVCTALMAVLLTCRMLRTDEDEGLVEVLRTAGTGQWVPLVAPLTVVLTAVALLAAGVGGVLHAETARVEELTETGAWSMAGTVTVTGWAFSALAAVGCQLARSGGSARTLGLGTLGIAFGMRVIADDADAVWLRWLTPLGWRDVVMPYTHDRFWPLGVLMGVPTVLLVCAALLYRRREYLGGYLPDFSVSGRRLRVRGHADLLVRLVARSTLAWAVVAAALSALFGSMADGLTDLLGDPSSPTASYVDKMAAGSPVEQFMSLLTVMTVLLAVVAATRRAGALAAAERRGLVEAELACGLPRTRLFLVRAAVALTEGAGLLVVSGGVLAATTAARTTADHAVGRAFVFAVSQLPGILAAVGIVLALVALAPRWVGLVWAVVGWSVFARIFGGLVELPDWAKDLSLLGHHLDVVGPVDWKPLAVQAAVGLGCLLLALPVYRRRGIPA